MRKLGILVILALVLPLTVSAQSVDLLWQGEGYSAPFYKGRTLWSKQSRITILAVPQGLGNPAALDYVWSKNGTVLGNASGVGKNSLTFVDNLFSKPVTVKVEIVRGDEDLLAETSLNLTPRPPFTAVYEDSPLYGIIFHREISGNYRLAEAEITFAGFPFFFNATGRDDARLTYKWSGRAGDDLITYRAPQGGSGTSLVSLSIAHQDDFMQTAVKSFLVEFGDDE